MLHLVETAAQPTAPRALVAMGTWGFEQLDRLNSYKPASIGM